MCACRCGIDVHLKDGAVVYIEGNRDHPVNRGVLCAKGSAGLKQHLSPARLRAPMKRVGPRGEGRFEEISWDEALQIATDWLAPIRDEAPEKLAFFTGRDQSQSFTSFWAQQFGTPNYAAHGGFCSVNMATAGIYTMGGAFWEFGQPDWDHARLFLLFGVAEDHDSNPIKMGLGKLKARGARVIGINPIRSGYNAVADDWIGITPGTDGLLILALIHVLLTAGKIDLDYLARWTNAPVLLNAAPGPEHGLALRDADGKALVIDRRTGALAPFDQPGIRPDLSGRLDRDGHVHRSVFQHLVERYIDPVHAPEAVAERCGVPASKIRALAAELARVAFDEAITLDRAWTDFRGERHAGMTGRPVAMHAMRGISAHANGFQTCRALHLLQILLGTVEVPGGMRFKPPYPKPAEAHPRPHCHVRPGRPLDGPHLGFVQGPDDLALTPEDTPARIDKAFTWDNPLSAHGLMHMVIANAHAGDPYRIDTLFLYMANMAWNSSMNTAGTMAMLTDRDAGTGEYVIPRIIYSDAYDSEMVAYADLILPDTTYLERHDCISLLDRPISEADEAADAIRWPVVAPDRDVRGFQSVLCDLGHRLGLPASSPRTAARPMPITPITWCATNAAPASAPLRVGGRATARPEGAARAVPTNSANTSTMAASGPPRSRPRPQYFKPWNAAYQDWAVGMGFYDTPVSPTSSSSGPNRCAASSWPPTATAPASPPTTCARKLRDKLDPLPIWYPPDSDDPETYPIHALTQRPMAMYHSWGSQNAWLRQIHGRNPLYVPTALMRAHALADGDWVKVTSAHGTITVPVMEMAALNPHTIWTWNAIGKRKGAWALDPQAPEATKGFLLNHLIPSCCR
jgi:anaerobic selenocysteine-containing dehydrogenase